MLLFELLLSFLYSYQNYCQHKSYYSYSWYEMNQIEVINTVTYFKHLFYMLQISVTIWVTVVTVYNKVITLTQIEYLETNHSSNMWDV